MTEQPTNRTISTPDELADWHQWLSEEAVTAAIVDSHNRPRLMCESEDGVLYATDPYSDLNAWSRAQAELRIFGPFRVLWPAAPGTSDEGDT